MKQITFLFYFSLSVVLFACKNDKQSTDQSNENSTKTTLKDISELSYMELYYQLFPDGTGGFDAHGDLYGQDAISSLSISETNSNCGKALLLVNASENDITLAIRSSFNFPGNPAKEIVRAYTIKASDQIAIGNSKLCYNNKEYSIKKDIISAGILTN